MKKFKLFLTILLGISVIFVSCKDPEVEHKHNFSEKWEIDEYYHWKKCSCGEIDFETEHSFGDWQVIKAATEEAEGKQERKCTVCPYTATEVIEKLAHTHKFATDWTKDGTYHWYAATCEHTTEVSGKAAHSFGDWTVTKAATEEAEGSRERNCTVCGYTTTEVIEKLAHTHKFATDWTKDETHHWYASTCGHITEVSGKAAHSFGDWKVIKDATEDIEGSKKRTCSVCLYENIEVIPTLNHTHKFSDEWTSDAIYHWHVSTCGHAVIEDKLEHNFAEWNVTKESTCTENGERKTTCTICGYEKTEKTDKAEHTYTNGICVCGLPKGFALIPAGTFTMGSNVGFDRNKPVHEVTITKSFYMGKYEVTQVEYEFYCTYGKLDPTSSHGDGENYPAYYVSWYDTLVYCNKRSIAEGLIPCYSISGNTDPSAWGTIPTSSNSTWNAVKCDWNANGYRLPTEAEWEYAARAGNNTVATEIYSGTSDIMILNEYAWYKDNSNSTSHVVGLKLPNSFCLYDMSGNVYEWCWNRLTGVYDEVTEGGNDPKGYSSGSSRVLRGGDCINNSDHSAVFYRSFQDPGTRMCYVGFRVVRSAN